MNEDRGTRYRRRRRRIEAADAAAGGLGLLLLAVTPAASALSDWTGRLTGSLSPAAAELAGVTTLAAVLAALVGGVRLPVRAARARLERRFGRPEAPSPSRWPAATAAIGVCAALAVLWRVGLWVAGPAWWLVAGLVAAAAMAVALHGAPVVVARLSGARPVSKPSRRTRLAALGRRVRPPIGISEVPVTAGDPMTAFVAGAGPFRRVFVASSLVDEWPEDQEAVVVAHELGHHARQDLWRSLALDAALVVAAFGLAEAAARVAIPWLGIDGPAEPAALPLLALVAGGAWWAAAPVRYAQSRRHERRADAFSLAMTRDADAFDAVIRRLGERHLAEDRPSALARWLSHRHPPVGERLASAEAYRAGRLGSPVG